MFKQMPIFHCQKAEYAYYKALQNYSNFLGIRFQYCEMATTTMEKTTATQSKQDANLIPPGVQWKSPP